MTADGAQRLAHVFHRGVDVSRFRANGGRDDLGRIVPTVGDRAGKTFPSLETRAMKPLAPTLLP
jgi:hypothetical protein